MPNHPKKKKWQGLDLYFFLTSITTFWRAPILGPVAAAQRRSRAHWHPQTHFMSQQPHKNDARMPSQEENTPKSRMSLDQKHVEMSTTTTREATVFKPGARSIRSCSARWSSVTKRTSCGISFFVSCSCLQDLNQLIHTAQSMNQLLPHSF